MYAKETFALYAKETFALYAKETFALYAKDTYYTIYPFHFCALSRSRFRV
jgi:hypothetical protein